MMLNNYKIYCLFINQVSRFSNALCLTFVPPFTIDNYDTAEPGMKHSGIKNIYGELHTDLTDVMKEVNKGIYKMILQ